MNCNESTINCNLIVNDCDFFAINIEQFEIRYGMNVTKIYLIMFFMISKLDCLLMKLYILLCIPNSIDRNQYI